MDKSLELPEKSRQRRTFAGRTIHVRACDRVSCGFPAVELLRRIAVFQAHIDPDHYGKQLCSSIPEPIRRNNS